jgi:hypothetical protein
MGLVRQIVILTTAHCWSVLAMFLTENALMIFGLSSKIFCELLPGFPGEGY